MSAAERRMVERNLGLVHSVARSYSSSGVPLADLVQEGTIGLMRAVERFDPDRGVKFSTYAMFWIRRSVLDAIGASKLIRIPPKARRQPDVPRVTDSLDEPVGEDASALADLIADPRAADPSETAIEHERRDEVSAMLRLLPERHRDVVVRRYGLDGADIESHSEIGRSLGVGEQRSRQLERESLNRLRSMSAALAQAA